MSPNCTECAFAFEVTDNKPITEIGRKIFVCKFMPPVPVLIPNGRNMALSPMFPPVNSDLWCAQFQARELGRLPYGEG